MVPGTWPVRASAPARSTFAHRALVLAVVVLAGVVLTACGGSAPRQGPEKPRTSVAPSAPAVGVSATAADGRGAIRPLPALSGCTRTLADASSAKEALSKAKPGDKFCITGDLGDFRMKINYSGTEQAPIQVVGDGQTRVRGIDVDASYVLVDGFTVLNAKSPEIQLNGVNITLQNTVARHATTAGYDSMQFFGDNIKILHNTLGGNSGDPTEKPNCIETSSTDVSSSPSHNVLIDSNRCESTTSACLSVAGPHGPRGTGLGQTSEIKFTNNYCQAQGAAVLLNDVQNATISGNTAEGADHAWSLQNNSTGATVAANIIAPGTAYEVGMDDSSKPGYQGPAVGGAP